MHLLPLLFLALSIITLACSSPKYSSSPDRSNSSSTANKSLVRFESSAFFAPIMEKASKLDKPIFLEFYTSWCAPCKLMDKDVFTHRETANFLNSHFVNYKVNAEKGNGPDLALIYGVKSLPTLLFVDENGKVLLRHEGVAYHKTLKEIGQMVLDQKRSLTIGH